MVEKEQFETLTCLGFYEQNSTYLVLFWALDMLESPPTINPAINGRLIIIEQQ